MFSDGMCYIHGEGIAVDKHEGIKWYARSGEAGLAESQYILGLIYESGDGVPVDLHTAIKWYTLASEAGYLDAKDTLARLSIFD